MNTLKKLSFIGLIITLLLPSCTMQKRLYMDGYHFESLTTKHKRHNRTFKNCSLSTKKKNRLLQPDENYSITIESQTTAPPINENNTIVTEDNTNIVASANKKQIILSQKEKHNTLSNNNIKTTISYSKVPPKHSFKQVFNNRIKTFTGVTKNNELSNKKDKPRLSNSALVGFISSIVGLLLIVAILVWPSLFGKMVTLLSATVLAILGIIVSAIGLVQKSKGRGFAVAGLVLGIILVITFLGTLFAIAFYS